MKKIFRIALGLILVASITGCGQSEEAKQARENTLVVGMECNYAPFNWTTLDKTDTSVAITAVDYCDGYDVAIAQFIADDLQMDLEIRKTDWKGLEPAVSAGEIDAIIAGMTKTPERAENADFTTPYYESEMVIIVRKDSDLVNISSLAELAGKTVLGQINTLYDDVIDQIPEVVHATPLDSYPRMIVSLQNGEVDAITGEYPVAYGIVQANPDLALVQFSEGQGFEADTTVSIAVKKGNTELLDKIQSSLDKLDSETRQQMMLDATNRQPSNE